MKIVYMFPGQNSRYPEMIDRLLALGPWNGTILEHASDVLHRDLRAHFQAQHEAMFFRNRDVQLGVFLANHMYYQSLYMAGVTAELSLGLSLGEYNHLVHIGALDFETALTLLEARGQAYEQGPQGAMAAVFPVALERVREVVAEVRYLGQLDLAIHNAPKQQVLAGEMRPLAAALARLATQDEVQSVVFEPRLPMHTPLFKPVAEVFHFALAAVPWRRPTLPYLPNVLGQVLEHPSAEQVVDLLTRHVWSPVLWRESIDALAQRYDDLGFVEVGPRAVLYNLLGKKWHRCPKYTTDSQGDLLATFMALAEELRSGSFSTPVVA